MIKCEDKDFIIAYLREENEILNLNIIGAIENITAENFGSENAQLEIYVDNLLAPKGVVVKEHGYWHYVYSKSDEFIYQAKREIFDAYEEYGIDAASRRVYEILSEGKTVDWKEICDLLYIQPEGFSPVENHQGLVSGDESYAEVINEHYTFRDETSLYFIEECLRNRPSSILLEVDEPVAWVLIHRDNSMGIMYTKASHRGKGLAYALSMDLIEKEIKRGKIPFIHVGVENTPSLNLAEKCGFEKYDTIYWFGIRN